MNQNLKKRGLIGFVALAALTCALPVHAQDDDEIKKNNAKGDTLIFNASDFLLPEGANLDRLLRKLPGITYYSSGNVEMDGITIKEMTVETKSFFKNSITSITSRIPAYAIQTIKFYDYDQGKRMSIKLKKEYKKKWWAEFSAALGPDNRYSEKVFAMIDDKKLRMTVYGNVNDINDSRQPGQETEWTPAEAAKNQRTTQTAGFDYRKKEKKMGCYRIHGIQPHQYGKRNRCQQDQLHRIGQHLPEFTFPWRKQEDESRYLSRLPYRFGCCGSARQTEILL